MLVPHQGNPKALPDQVSQVQHVLWSSSRPPVGVPGLPRRPHQGDVYERPTQMPETPLLLMWRHGSSTLSPSQIFYRRNSAACIRDLILSLPTHSL